MLAEKAILDLRGPIVRVTGLRRPLPVLDDRGRLPAVAQACARRDLEGHGVLMAYEFRMPDLGEGVAEGEIVRWLVAVGEEVAEDDLLVEIQTDKATVEVPSPAAGRGEPHPGRGGRRRPGGRAPRRDRLAEDGGPGIASSAVTEAAQSRVQATPAVRRLAAELGVDLAALAGDGPVTEAAVRGPPGRAGGRPARAAARRPARDRRASGPLASRGAGGDRGRGVRLHPPLADPRASSATCRSCCAPQRRRSAAMPR